MRLWRRQYTVTVDTIRTSELDVQFGASKTLAKEANTCDLIVYNLNEDHRRELGMLTGGPAVTIEAGYVENIGQIYAGQLREVTSYQRGPDWITELHSGDQEERLAKARINRSYSAGTRVDVVVKDLAESMKVGLGNSIKAALTGNLRDAGREFLKGVTFSGSNTRELDRMLKSIGKEWSIQDGELQVVDTGYALPGPTIRLDPKSGLIGSPTLGSDYVLKARSLMNHSIVPGRAVEVESKEVTKALYRVERCDYAGDTFGTDWYVDFEALLYVPALVSL